MSREESVLYEHLIYDIAFVKANGLRCMFRDMPPHLSNVCRQLMTDGYVLEKEKGLTKISW